MDMTVVKIEKDVPCDSDEELPFGIKMEDCEAPNLSDNSEELFLPSPNTSNTEEALPYRANVGNSKESLLYGENLGGISDSIPCAQKSDTITVPHVQKKNDNGKRRRYSELSILKKKEVLDLLDAGKSHRDLGKLFNVSKSAIANVKTQQAKIIEAWEKNYSSDRKRLRRSTTNDELNQKVFTFFVECRAKSIPITGTMLQERARFFAETMGIENFKASNGWLGAFKKRNNIVSFQFSGNSTEAESLVGQDANNVHVLVNTDDGVFSLRQPKKSLVLMEETCKGGSTNVSTVEEDKQCEEDNECEEDNHCEAVNRFKDSGNSSEISDVITNLNAVMRHQHQEENDNKQPAAAATKDQLQEIPLRRHDALILVKELQRFALETQPEIFGALISVRRAIEEAILVEKSKAEQQATVNRILNGKNYCKYCGH